MPSVAASAYSRVLLPLPVAAGMLATVDVVEGVFVCPGAVKVPLSELVVGLPLSELVVGVSLSELVANAKEGGMLGW
jgi:hypothetical protein